MKRKKSSPIPTIIMTIFIITGAVTLTVFFTPLYYIDVYLLGLPEKTAMSASEIIANYHDVIVYYIPLLNQPLELTSLAMSEQGRIHFEDVKKIVDFFIYGFVISLPFALFTIKEQRYKRRYGYLKQTAIALLILPVLVGGLIAVNWQWTFTTFHQVFFSNDYWVFDPRYDPIINILPDLFFMHCAIMIIALILIGSLVCYRRYNKLTYKALSQI